MSKRYGIQARVKSGSDEVEITDFTFVIASGELGATASCALADFSPVISPSLPVSFEIGISKSGQTHWAMLLDDGRISERTDATQFKGDQTSINVISKLSEKWKLAPRAPITLYDPAQVDIITLSSQNRGDIVDQSGAPIAPIYRPVAALDLLQLLNFIYVERLAFGQVITNIPDYPIPRADFGLTTPYHSVAAGQVGLFEPKYSSDAQATLFIIDPQGALPAGFPAQVRACSPGTYAELQKTKQTAPDINAVLLTYRDSSGATGNHITERVEQEIQEAGIFGDDDWQRTMINRFIKEFHGDSNDSTRITRSVVYKTETRISARIDGLARLISIETQEDHYAYDWQLKVGYTKTLQLYMKLPLELAAHMQTIQTETNQIIWLGAMSSPNTLVKTWEITEVNGTVLVIGEQDDPSNPPLRQSAYDANRGGEIPDDAEVLTGRPISSLIERWREVGPDQIEVGYQKVNHLARTGSQVEQNRTVQHTGTVQARLNSAQDGRQVTMLLRDQTSEALDGTLPPATLDAGDIPFDPALELANRVLARHGQTPQRVKLTGAGIDLALRRGSLRRVSDRAGVEYLVFVTGYSIEGKNLGTRDFSVTQQAEGIVIQEL